MALCSILYTIFSMRASSSGDEPPVTQTSAESSQGDSSAMLNPTTSYNVTASVIGERGMAQLVVVRS